MSAASVKPAPARSIVTAEALVVAPTIVGLPLAGPWQRLTAMIVDLAVVGLLSFLATPWLGLATGALLFLLFGNDPAVPLTQKAVRWSCRALGVLIAVLSAVALGHVPLLRNTELHLEAFTGRPESKAMTTTILIPPNASAGELHQVAGRLQEQVDDLKAEQRELQAASSSWAYGARVFANALGVTFGWSGVYFTIVAGACGGRTLGKLLMRTRAVKINGTPFTFFDGFVRQGGYVAGVAMGLIGFLKLLWEPNRQAVEDRIAGTVVIRSSTAK
jgi:uncharacterized RDD family membrane protein YckC